jgi:hypothetical protein
MNPILQPKINPTQKVGLINYYLLCAKLVMFKNKQEIQEVMDQTLVKLSLLKLEGDRVRLTNIFNLCVNLGAKLNLPILKLKPKKSGFGVEKWIYDFEQKEILENPQIYDFLINNVDISSVDKCKLDSIFMQSLMADLILINYKKNISYLSSYLEQKFKIANQLNSQYCAMSELENILHRGNVFKNQISRFLALTSIFSYREIFDNLSVKFKSQCYQEFSKMSVLGKKALTAILIKNKNEEAIFNLLNYGLKLNWDIAIEDGRKNIVAFEMLYSLQWVKAILDHPNLDIRLTNSRGENILHLLGASALEDSSIEESLSRKIVALSEQQKSNLFFQTNEEGLTPLMKAVVFQDENLINFITNFNVKPWDKLDGAPMYESAMDFLNNQVLRNTEENTWGSLMDYFKDSFWLGLAKKWNSEFYYLKLQKEISSNKKDKKLIKI